MTAAGRLDVGVIGAGRVGPVLAAALAGAGHRVVAVHAVSAENLERVDALLPGVPVLEPAEVVARSELVLLAVPGEQLPGLVAGLAAVGAWRPGQLVLHTNAAQGVAVLAPAVAAGAIPLAIHPALRFSGTSLDLLRLREAWCAVTAPGPVLPIGQALVLELGAEPLVVAEADRAAYAEAVDTAAAFSAAVVAQAMGLLEGIGVASPGSVLGPVVRSAVDGALGRLQGDRLDPAPFPDPSGPQESTP